MILDGWGLSDAKDVSAVDHASTPFIDGLYQKYAHSKLQASGPAVGLPEGQMGKFRGRAHEYRGRAHGGPNFGSDK